MKTQCDMFTYNVSMILSRFPIFFFNRYIEYFVVFDNRVGHIDKMFLTIIVQML